MSSGRLDFIRSLMFFPSFLSGGMKRITVSRRTTEAGLKAPAIRARLFFDSGNRTKDNRTKATDLVGWQIVGPDENAIQKGCALLDQSAGNDGESPKNWYEGREPDRIKGEQKKRHDFVEDSKIVAPLLK